MASAGVSAVNPCLSIETEHKYPSFAECVASFKASKLKNDHAPSQAIAKNLDEAMARKKAVYKARNERAKLKRQENANERKKLREEAKEQRAKEQREERQKVLEFILSRKTKKGKKCKL